MNQPACDGPVSLRDPDAVHKDIANLKSAVKHAEPADVFMTAASPGVIAAFLANSYYPSDEEYIFALADAMKPEYDAIAAAGIVLQVDCPDLAMTRAMLGNDMLTDDEFRNQIRMHVRALNYALRDIPPEQMRMHLCWGNGEWPHITDIPLASIIDIVLEARPTGLVFEAANPRHEHEWKVWKDIRLPEGKVLIPGVLDIDDELRRASRAGGRADRQVRGDRRPRERDRRHRLRFRHVRRLLHGQAADHLAQARLDGRGRTDRV